MWKALDLLKRNVTRSLPPRSDTGARGSSGGGAPGVDSSSAKVASKTSAAWVPESIMNVKKYIFKADFPSWPASMETWGAVYNIQNDRDPPLLARFSDHTTKPATFRKFVGQCLNCLSDDGHNMRSCPKPFLNRSGLLNSKTRELPEPEKEAVWRRIQNRSKRRSQHRQKSHSTGNSQRRRNTDRSEVAVTTDQTKKFVKTPGSSESSPNGQTDDWISPSIPSVAFEGRSRTTRDNRAGVRKTHDDTAVDLPPECSQKRLLIDESASPTHIRRIDGAERHATRVRQRSQFQSPFSDRFPVTGHTGGQDETKEKPTPVTYEEQRGPLSQARLQKNDNTFSANVGTSGLRRVDRLPSWEGGPRITERQKDGGAAVLAVSSEHTQGKGDLINRKSLERSSGSPVPDYIKCFTQAMKCVSQP